MAHEQSRWVGRVAEALYNVEANGRQRMAWEAVARAMAISSKKFQHWPFLYGMFTIELVIFKLLVVDFLTTGNVQYAFSFFILYLYILYNW